MAVFRGIGHARQWQQSLALKSLRDLPRNNSKKMMKLTPAGCPNESMNMITLNGKLLNFDSKMHGVLLNNLIWKSKTSGCPQRSMPQSDWIQLKDNMQRFFGGKWPLNPSCTFISKRTAMGKMMFPICFKKRTLLAAIAFVIALVFAFVAVTDTQIFHKGSAKQKPGHNDRGLKMSAKRKWIRTAGKS